MTKELTIKKAKRRHKIINTMDKYYILRILNQKRTKVVDLRISGEELKYRNTEGLGLIILEGVKALNKAKLNLNIKNK